MASREAGGQNEIISRLLTSTLCLERVCIGSIGAIF